MTVSPPVPSSCPAARPRSGWRWPRRARMRRAACGPRSRCPGGGLAVADGDSGRGPDRGQQRRVPLRRLPHERLPIFSAGSDSLQGQRDPQGPRTGTIWFGTSTGVFRLAPTGPSRTSTRRTGSATPATSEVTCLAEDARRHDLGGHAPGRALALRRRGAGSTITTDQGLPSKLVSSASRSIRGPVDVGAGLAGTGSRRARARRGQERSSPSTTRSRSTASRNVRGRRDAPSGEVWFGIDGGIARLEHGVLTEYPATRDDRVRRSPQGRAANSGSAPRRAASAGSTTGTTVFFPSGPPSNSVQGLFVDRGGRAVGGHERGARPLRRRGLAPIAQAKGSRSGFSPLAAIRESRAVRQHRRARRDLDRDESIPGVGHRRVRRVARRVERRHALLRHGERVCRRRRRLARARGLGTGRGSGSRVSSRSAASRASTSTGSAPVRLGDAALRRRLRVRARGRGERVDRHAARSLAAESMRRACTRCRWARARYRMRRCAGSTSIAQGRLWIATGDQPARPDGLPGAGRGAVRSGGLVVPRGSSASNGLPTNNLTAVAAFTNGDVWFGSAARCGAAGVRGVITRSRARRGCRATWSRASPRGRTARSGSRPSAGSPLFDGANFTSFSVADGMAGGTANDVFADSLGRRGRRSGSTALRCSIPTARRRAPRS